MELRSVRKHRKIIPLTSTIHIFAISNFPSAIFSIFIFPCALFRPHFSMHLFPSSFFYPHFVIPFFAIRHDYRALTALKLSGTTVQRSILKIQNGGRVLSGNCTIIFRGFWYKSNFMLRIFRRYVDKTGRALSFCRYEHSSPVRSSLKWEETQFNGVEVNLSQLEDNPNLDEFSTRLKGKFTFCKKTRLVKNLRYKAFRRAMLCQPSSLISCCYNSLSHNKLKIDEFF